MTRLIERLGEIAADFDVAALDQYGVLHNGAAPYSGAADAVRWLEESGKGTAVLSNSGKRSDLNRRRIERIGIRLPSAALVETSGETAFRELSSCAPLPLKTPVRLLPIATAPGDAEAWAEGCEDISIVGRLCEAAAILLMGIPPGGASGKTQSLLEDAQKAELPLICTNPDRTSPSGDKFVLSPGVLADQFELGGGTVIWYGKPHRAVFDSVRRHFPQFPRRRFLMVGDSLMHDISGGASAGFATCFVRSGIHRSSFAGADTDEKILDAIGRLCSDARFPVPDYSLDALA